MSRSLADLRANPPKSRPERSVTICLKPHLVAEVQALTEELNNLPVAQILDPEGEKGPKPRQGQSKPKEHPRAAEIRERLGTLFAEMAEHEGELRIGATTTDGEWRNWANAHPGREEGEPGHKRDRDVTLGYCNADDLLEDLGKYAVSWNGEPLAEGDWDSIFAPNIGNPDLKQIATNVIAVFESRLDFSEWRRLFQDNLSRYSDSASLETSESAPDDSMVGSPEPSKSATTETEGESR